VSSVSIKPSFWKREHHLDRMTMKQLVVAYFQYPAVIAYLLLSVVAIGVWIARPAGPERAARLGRRLDRPLSSGLVLPPSLGAAQPVDVQGADAGCHLEAHPL
jgi:hypothetical protein